ncbi:MAG: hypothetical protein ABFS43_19140, partial [Thermodesulfobacteriota bacterium]
QNTTGMPVFDKQYPMSNYQVGVPLVGTRTATGDLRNRADTRPAPTRHTADCPVAQGFIPAKPCTEFRLESIPAVTVAF